MYTTNNDVIISLHHFIIGCTLPVILPKMLTVFHMATENNNNNNYNNNNNNLFFSIRLQVFVSGTITEEEVLVVSDQDRGMRNR